MKIINILNIEKNRDYIDKNNYVIKGIDNEGEYQMENPKLRCLRLWLDNEFPFEIINDHMEFTFENKSSNISFVANIIEKGIYNNKHYILANFWDYILLDPLTGDCEYDSKVFEVVLGKFEVDISFSTEMITNGDKLFKFLGGVWPSFHDSTITILEYSSKKIVLRFYNASHDDYVIDLTIKDIIFEDYGEKTLEFFTKGIIMYVKFLKKQDYMEVKICQYYCFENEGHIVDYKTQGIIRCRALEVNFKKI